MIVSANDMILDGPFGLCNVSLLSGEGWLEIGFNHKGKDSINHTCAMKPPAKVLDTAAQVRAPRWQEYSVHVATHMARSR